jgi:hypothetical protein
METMSLKVVSLVLTILDPSIDPSRYLLVEPFVRLMELLGWLSSV